ncbi:MAG TPA: hypothetical protein VF476_07875 [Chitinophagaceae bacterium]
MIRYLRKIAIISLACLQSLLLRAGGVEPSTSISLNGKWQMGFDRNYSVNADVPGIAADPSKMSDQLLWYKKEITLPAGNWSYATLELEGARFAPEVFVNGRSVSKQNGGMAPTLHLLNAAEVKPGKIITIEIALQSLKNVPPADASFIPPADQWRSNISSGLWDDVVLHLHGSLRIDRIIPFTDFSKKTVSVHYDLQQIKKEGVAASALLEVLDANGKSLFFKTVPVTSLRDSTDISYANKLKTWSPETPNLYQLRLTIRDQKKQLLDTRTISFAIKKFETKNKQFYLNDELCKLRGGTVVWHRWVRSQEGRELGFDTTWFKENIVQRLKDHGANYLRFHLGKPPERLLDLCDKYGLLVQYEWSFFHGMPATRESLLEQYKNWLDVAMRHPSVALVHPYNETEGEQLHTVWNALDQLLKDYPPLVMEERDVIHVHKYWWSLFENVGLYYDDANQFPQTIMVDEFGGNYLDEQGNLGGYKALKESYLRFLGRIHTVTERLKFHALANAKIAEYWRRINAAGFAPFTILSSFEDGNTWFMGPLKNGVEKPVWQELTAAFSPLSVSINCWDQNFTASQRIDLPLYFFNDTRNNTLVKARLRLTDVSGSNRIDTTIQAAVNGFSKRVINLSLRLPATTGRYKLSAELINRPAAVKYPVISSWEIRIVQAEKSAGLNNVKIAVPDEEKELLAFLQQQKITTVKLQDETANIVVTSAQSWRKIAAGDHQLLNALEAKIDKGVSVIMLDIGEKYLGQGYPSKDGDLGPLQGVARITDPRITQYKLFKGLSLKFTEAAEPESHLHADRSDSSLWKNIPKDYTWLWNGMRGGLVVPAADMEINGLSAEAFLAQWKARGADETAIRNGNYYAYELQGFYEYSSKPDDAALQKKLKDKVIFLVQDAPALANAINPATPIKVIDLANGFKSANNGTAKKFTALASCGKNLTRTPVAFIDFGKDKGSLILSQLLTAGRLANGYGEKGFYGIRYDEVAAQVLLNMIEKVSNRN